MIYGHNKTWHRTEHLDVEVDANGIVVSVWFRCIALPFQQTQVGHDRAVEMNSMYIRGTDKNRLLAVEVELPK